jgi:hypothetical protein
LAAIGNSLFAAIGSNWQFGAIGNWQQLAIGNWQLAKASPVLDIGTWHFYDRKRNSRS